MTKYPNSECDSHRDVTTSAPVCIVCMDREIEALRQDAERYRWLAQQFRMDPDMGGNHRWWACQPRPELRGPTLDAAIDAAMKGDNT